MTVYQMLTSPKLGKFCYIVENVNYPGIGLEQGNSRLCEQAERGMLSPYYLTLE